VDKFDLKQFGIEEKPKEKKWYSPSRLKKQVQRERARHFYRMATEKSRERNFPEAIKLFEKAISLSANSPQCYYNLGVALYEMAAYEKAEKVFRRAAELDSKFVRANFNLGMTYLKMGNAEKARHYLKKFYRDSKDDKSQKAWRKIAEGHIAQLKKEIEAARAPVTTPPPGQAGL